MKNHNNGRNLNKLTNDVILVASKICFKVLSKYFYAKKNLLHKIIKSFLSDGFSGNNS